MTRGELVYRIRHLLWLAEEPSMFEMYYMPFSVYEDWLAREPRLEQI